MTIPPEHLDALERLDYTPTEARFLYLVATHSGYFTRRQFLTFTHQPKGSVVHNFTTKAMRLKHVRPREYGRKTFVYNLYSRLVYRPLGKENLRNRRHLSTELVRTRLRILDFVLAHLDHEYLETEPDKVRFFRDQLGVPTSALPTRIYTGIQSNSSTLRHFVDRSPIFLMKGDGADSSAQMPTFVFCDGDEPSLEHYKNHLESYQRLWYRLTAFRFIYACSHPHKFAPAKSIFVRLFPENQDLDMGTLVRYFRLRRLWDEKKHGLLTRTDRDLLRAGDHRYHAPAFQSAYQKWLAGSLLEDSVAVVLDPNLLGQKRSFEAYQLPLNYDIFHGGNSPVLRPPSSGPGLAQGPLHGRGMNPPNSLLENA